MDKFFNATVKRINQNIIFNILFFSAIIVFAVCGLFGTYSALQKNSAELGNNLVESYSNDEELSIATFETLMNLCMSYMEDFKENGMTQNEIDHAFRKYFSDSAAASGYTNLEFYALYDGRTISSNYTDKTANYNYTGLNWYKKAMKENGDIVYLNVLSDEEEQKYIHIAVKVDPETGNGILLNLSASLFAYTHAGIELPDESAYYLFDAEGMLLYCKTPFSISGEQPEAYAESISKRFMSDSDRAKDDLVVIDPDNVKRLAYTYKMSNGWLCVMTVPKALLFRNLSSVVWWYIGVFLLFVVVSAFMIANETKLNKNLKHSADTVHALCNSFYAIYRVNVAKGTYEMVKGSDEVKEILPRHGSYDMLLNKCTVFMEQETAESLLESFSLEQIRELVENNISGFGGDFQRKIDGVDRWVHLSLILDDNLNKEEAVISFRLVDDEKNRQLEYTALLENALAAADAGEKSQKQFIANISHDMRTPLNIIIGMNELASRPDCTDDKRREYLKKIDFTSRSLLSLINNVLDISRMEQDQLPFNKRTFDICDELELCTRPYRQQAAAEGKEFELKTEVENRMVIGDSAKLVQILTNLLSNALKFTHKCDKISLTVRQAGKNNKNYIFVIEDTGIGMSKEFLPKLFEPFAREKRFGTSSSDGSGLGMAIVKNLVAQKGGQIAVESEPGKGTSFVVTLPFAPGNVKTVDDVPDKKEDKQDGDVLRHLRILQAEDNELNREIMCELLTENGAIVTSAYDGQNAVEIFERSKPNEFDVILMDMQMPRMDGCEAAAAIRALDRPDAKTVKIIALTANSFSEDVIRTTRAGMDAHLAKPADLSVLCETLKELL